MNCCNNNNNNDHNSKGGKHRGHVSHLWMMALCCGLPIIVLAVVSLLGSSIPGVRNVLVTILPFLCPVMMIAMIPMMLRGNRGGGQNSDSDKPSDRLPEKRD